MEREKGLERQRERGEEVFLPCSSSSGLLAIFLALSVILPLSSLLSLFLLPHFVSLCLPSPLALPLLFFRHLAFSLSLQGCLPLHLSCVAFSLCVFAPVRVSLCVCAFFHMCVRACVYVCACVCLCARRVSLRVFILCLCICLCLCVCVCVLVLMHVLLYCVYVSSIVILCSHPFHVFNANNAAA